MEKQMQFDLPQHQPTIILSLQPEPYQAICDGVKHYEYRRKFLKTPVNAFIYVSSPINQMRGFVQFGEPVFDTIERIAEISEREKPGSRAGALQYLDGLEKGFAIPIVSFREIPPISLDELRANFEFTAPQSFFYLETRPALKKALMTRLSHQP